MLRIAALVVVCVGVSGTVRGALAQLSEHSWTVRPAWLVVSGAVYVLGMAPMGWFWQRTLVALGYQPPLSATMRAYYFGQLGKYVPGKAMVIILRVAAMRRWAPSMRLVIVSVFIETLTMMAVGALLACLISALVLKSDPYIWLIALGMAVAAGVPTLPMVLQWFGRIGAGRLARADEAKPEAQDPVEVGLKLRGITLRVLGTGWIAAIICWLLFATSLWGTLRAIGVDGVQLFLNMPVLITAVAFAVVAGFLSMLPGGLVVRDAVLMQLLAPVCGEANALVAAVLMRLVWLVSEVAACGILYIARGGRGRRSGDRYQGAQ
jgi:glycosyltransferase 2 family protein